MDLLTPANNAMRALIRARGADSRHITVQGHPVHRYRLSGTGSGPPIVLLHGLGSSANAFARVMFDLQRHFRAVWAIDLPGNGFSPLPDSGPATLEAQVRLLIEFLKTQVEQPAFLIGNSLGGAMSLFAASEAPEAIAALGLVSPAGARVEPHRLRELMSAFDISSNAQARVLTRRLFHKAPLFFELMAGQLRTLYGSAAVKGVLSEVKESDFVEPERLKRLSMPTMLVWGKSEKLLPYEGIEYFRAHLPSHAEIHEVAGFGHLPQMERPSQLVDLLLAFARRHSLVQ